MGFGLLLLGAADGADLLPRSDAEDAAGTDGIVNTARDAFLIRLLRHGGISFLCGASRISRGCRKSSPLPLGSVAAVPSIEASASQWPSRCGLLQFLRHAGALAFDHRLEDGDGSGQAAGDIFSQGLAERLVG